MAAREFRVQEESLRDQLIAIGSSLFFLAVITGRLFTRPQFRTSFGCRLPPRRRCFSSGRWCARCKPCPGAKMARGHRRSRRPLRKPRSDHGPRLSASNPALAPARRSPRCERPRASSLPYDLEDAHEVLEFVADMLSDRWPESAADELARISNTDVSGRRGTDCGFGRRYLLDARAPVGPTAVRGCDGAGRRGLCSVAAPFSVRRLTVGRHDLTMTKGTKPRLLDYADIEAVGLFVVGGKPSAISTLKSRFATRGDLRAALGQRSIRRVCDGEGGVGTRAHCRSSRLCDSRRREVGQGAREGFALLEQRRLTTIVDNPAVDHRGESGSRCAVNLPSGMTSRRPIRQRHPVRDDSPMASPPQSLRSHDCGARGGRDCD